MVWQYENNYLFGQTLKNNRFKNNLLILGKVLFSVGLIAWLLNGADFETIWITVKTADAGYLIAAFCMFYIGYVVIALRWQLLLKAQNIHAPLSYLLESFTIAMLFNNLLPSTIGGDAYRMYDIWKIGGNKSQSVSIILIDRCFGMFALVCYGFVAALLASEVRDAVPGLVFYLGSIIAAMLIFMWMVFGSGAGILDWFLNLQTGLLSLPQRIVRKLTSGLNLFRGRGDVLIRALFLSFVLQLNVIIHFIIVTYALGIEIPWSGMFVIIPLATLIMLLPVSINGVGVREAIFVFFFALYGVMAESAIAFAWVALAMLLAQGVIGGIVFILRRRRPGNQGPDDDIELMEADGK